MYWNATAAITTTSDSHNSDRISVRFIGRAQVPFAQFSAVKQK